MHSRLSRTLGHRWLIWVFPHLITGAMADRLRASMEGAVRARSRSNHFALTLTRTQTETRARDPDLTMTLALTLTRTLTPVFTLARTCPGLNSLRSTTTY